MIFVAEPTFETKMLTDFEDDLRICVEPKNIELPEHNMSEIERPGLPYTFLLLNAALLLSLSAWGKTEL